LHHSAAIECPVKAINGALYLRLSVHVYNCLDDYSRLADAVDAFLASERHPRLN
jgi:selenocysteine lyase/cysteine desulfurase